MKGHVVFIELIVENSQIPITTYGQNFGSIFGICLVIVFFKQPLIVYVRMRISGIENNKWKMSEQPSFLSNSKLEHSFR